MGWDGMGVQGSKMIIGGCTSSWSRTLRQACLVQDRWLGGALFFANQLACNEYDTEEMPPSAQ
jgi:hypothetical protein